MANRKSLVPLFGVAFIVAIISTGIFYGLFVGKLNSASIPEATGRLLIATKAVAPGSVLKAEDINQIPWSGPTSPSGAITKMEEAIGQTVVEPISKDELVTKTKLAHKNGGSVDGGSMGIPEGMRAVSLSVQDSFGVVAMLKAGHRIDVQVVGQVQGQFGQEPQLRTILENLQVLTVPREPQMQRGNAQIITVLATPKEAGVLGLADSTAKVRISLRNPIDQKRENAAVAPLGNVRPSATYAPVANVARVIPAPQPKPAQQVQFTVRLVGAGKEAMTELASQMDDTWRNGTDLMQVSAVRAEAAVDRMQQNKSLEVLTTSRVQTSPKQEAGAQWSLESGTTGAGVKIQFAPSVQADGKVRLRVLPEVTTGSDKGVNKRKVETEVEVADGQTFIVRGLTDASRSSELMDKLFPGRTPGSNQEMLVIVTPKLIKSTPNPVPGS